MVVIAVAAACGAAFVVAGRPDETSGRSYRLVFDNAFGLVKGGDLRVGGVKAGKTTGFDVSKRTGEAPKAVVVAEITEPGFEDFRSDARCEIRPQSLIGEYYVDCQPGSAPRRLDDGATVPVEQTSSTIPTDLVNNILRRPYRERLRLIVTELGTGLAGRPDDLQEVLRRAHPGLRETSRVLRILGDQNDVIERFIRDSDTVVAELENRKHEVVRWVREAGDAAAIAATRRDELRAGLRRLPTFLDELRPTMQRLGALADEQTPLLVDLRRAAPDVDTFFARAKPFAEAGGPAVRSLGAAAAVGTRAFRKGRDEMAELRALAAEAPAFAKPLRQFLQTIDDRRRAIEDDPRAKASAPPAPDPTAIAGSGGFTGMEAIWNFFLWQGLSINMLDDTSHILRASLTANECSLFHNDRPRNEADRQLFERCNAYLGPNQPGINSPDPLDDGANPAAARVRAEAGKPPARAGELRGEGEPEAGPLPGQPDLSRPQVTLPPPLQEVLDELPPQQQLDLPTEPEALQRQLDQLGQSVPDTQQTAEQLLDFLLAP
jgi:ABC-type transporter Mla subunit MlaD